MPLKKFLILIFIIPLLGAGAGGFTTWRWAASGLPPEQREALGFAVQT